LVDRDAQKGGGGEKDLKKGKKTTRRRKYIYSNQRPWERKKKGRGRTLPTADERKGKYAVS